MVNEAALLAGRQNKIVVEKIDFIQAVERSIAVRISVSLEQGMLAHLLLYVADFDF